MRLVIFGTGRVGTSIAHYARHLGLGVDAIDRRTAEESRQSVLALIAEADVVAAAIPDDFLAGWFAEWRPDIEDLPAIHFSGARIIEGMRGYHPLYSFPKTPLAPAVMAEIAIARETGAPPFSTIFKGARNPEFEIRPEDRAFYHALAVLSGNFAAHLWNETAKAMAARLRIAPEAAMGAYIAGVVDRFRESPFDSLTGPVARKDAATVRANLAALEAEPALLALYQAFLKSAWPGFETDGGAGA